MQCGQKIGIGHAEAFPPYAEGVQVRIGPAHDGLQHVLQPAEADVDGHLDAPLDRRADVPERDLKLIDIHRVLRT